MPLYKHIPTRAELLGWAKTVCVVVGSGMAGAAIMAIARPANPPGKPLATEPRRAIKSPDLVLFSNTAKGHFYPHGFSFRGTWEQTTETAFIDELMAFRLRNEAARYSVLSRGGFEAARNNSEEPITVLPQEAAQAPDQIGRLFLVRGHSQVVALTQWCRDIIGKGLAVEIPVEAFWDGA